MAGLDRRQRFTNGLQVPEESRLAARDLSASVEMTERMVEMTDRSSSMPPADVAPTTNARCPCRMVFSRAENGGSPPQLENPPPPAAYSPWGLFLAVPRMFAVCHPISLLCHPDRSGGISRRQARFVCLLHAAVLPLRVNALDEGDPRGQNPGRRYTPNKRRALPIANSCQVFEPWKTPKGPVPASF